MITTSGKLSAEQRANILSSTDHPTVLAARYGVHRSTIVRLKTGKTYVVKPAEQKRIELHAKIVELYAQDDKTMIEIAKELNVSSATVFRRASRPTREQRKKARQELRAQIVTLYYAKDLSQSQVARKFKISRSTVSRILSKLPHG